MTTLIKHTGESNDEVLNRGVFVSRTLWAWMDKRLPELQRKVDDLQAENAALRAQLQAALETIKDNELELSIWQEKHHSE